MLRFQPEKTLFWVDCGDVIVGLDNLIIERVMIEIIIKKVCSKIGNFHNFCQKYGKFILPTVIMISVVE